MRARDDDRADTRLGQALQLGGDTLHRSARLHIAVEQVAGDQEEVHLLRQGEFDRGHEGRELPLALRRRLVSQVIVARSEMDVSGMDDA